MSEELLQRDLLDNPESIGKWNFYNIGATSIKALKEYGIIKNIASTKCDKRKPDGLLTNKGQVIALISNKIPSKLQAHKDKDLADWVDVAKTLNCKLLILTDGKTKSYWVNAFTGKSVKDEAGEDVKTVFNPKSDEIPKLIFQITESIDEKNNSIRKVELKDPTQLAKSVWQDIWSVSGDDAEVCLYTFVEIFIFKYLSDLNLLTGSLHFNEILKLYEKDTPEQVLDFYANTVRKEIKRRFKASTTDNTTIINGSTFINKDGEAVSGYSTVFKKILGKFREYEMFYGKFDYIHYEFKSKVFETFLKESISKKNWGQYFTPLKVVRGIVKMAKSDVRDGITVCDPACGVGKFLLEMIAENPNKFYKFENNELKRRVNFIGYDKGFEDKEMKTIILAKANMLIYLSEIIREHHNNSEAFSDLFNDTFKLQTKSILGTLFYAKKNEYDIILTNPPYVVDGSSNLKDEIKEKGLQLHYSVPSLGVEGLFMQWIIQALKPNGKAYVIIPTRMLHRIPDKHLRNHIADKCTIEAVISLPSKTFFTTTEKTSIIVLTKKDDDTEIQKEPVFSYLVSDIGETLDINRFDTKVNDLDIAASLFNQFKNDKRHFKTTDARCKILPATFFTDQFDNWDTDRQWSMDEKISLGIEEKKNVLTVKEYVNVMSKYGDMLTRYEDELLNLQPKSKDSYVEISLLDKSYFRLTRGKRITKKTINNNRGDVPVYSSSQDGNRILGSIDENYLRTQGLLLFTQPSILFNIDGSIGHCFIKRDRKYSFIDVVASLEALDVNIDMEYLKIQLEKEIALSGANYQSKLYFGKIKNYQITIKIPTDKAGNFDLDKQRELASKYQLLSGIKSEMQNQTNYLVTSFINL